MDPVSFSLIAVALVLVALLAGLLFWSYKEMRPLFHFGPPFVPTSPQAVSAMLRLARLTPKDTVEDLGSGDGRLLFEAVREGAAAAVGYEIDGGLVRKSRAKAAKLGLQDRITVRHESFWQADLSHATVVFVYGISFMMKRLRHKLETELPRGARIVSNGFAIPGWEPKAKDGGVYLYVKP